MELSCHFEGIKLRDENDLWKVFDDIYKLINKKDELYIDLTHAFRYLPMLMLVLSNYSRFLKESEVKYLSYGNFQSREPEKPMVDLLSLSELQQWTSAASEYLHDGYVEELVNLFSKSKKNSIDDEGYSRKSANEFINLLPTFINDRLTCRGNSIINENTNLALKVKGESITSLGVKAINPLFNEIKESIHAFDNIMDRVVDAASWCFEHHMWQQSLTILQEGIVTFFCKRHSMNPEDDTERKLVTSAFSIISNSRERAKWIVSYCYLAKLITLLNDPLLKEVSGSFKTLTDLRNNYNHAGFCHKTPIEKNTIKKVINQIKNSSLVKNDIPEVTPFVFNIHRFLNLSNHPSSAWSKEQEESARQYGEIRDMAFPQIPTNASTEDIEELAEETKLQILDAYSDSDLTVHVMGEMTFTYALVSKLKAAGVRCVASCTDRIVKDLGGGKRLSEFHFTQFREY